MNPLLLSIGFQLGQVLLDHFTKAKAPQSILKAIQATLDAIEAHAKDVMSIEDWEALRG